MKKLVFTFLLSIVCLNFVDVRADTFELTVKNENVNPDSIFNPVLTLDVKNKSPTEKNKYVFFVLDPFPNHQQEINFKKKVSEIDLLGKDFNLFLTFFKEKPIELSHNDLSNNTTNFLDPVSTSCIFEGEYNGSSKFYVTLSQNDHNQLKCRFQSIE